MAASFSRPDPSSPASVAEAGFSIARRGYQADEVRAFLVAVAAELGRLQERERHLESELRRERTVTRAGQELDEATVAELLGEETVRVIQTARESAALIKARAEEAAARILGDAHDEASRLRQEVDVETARRRHDAVADAEAEVALAKQQGREMVNEARAYRERVLADLERRTTLARQQIDDLLGGRDRLLQAFERARLVALDVTSSLQSVDLPDEVVNLAPTTGPVPMMVPAVRPVEPAESSIDEMPVDDVPSDDAAVSVDGPAEDQVASTSTVDLFDGRALETDDAADGFGDTDAGVDAEVVTTHPDVDVVPDVMVPDDPVTDDFVTDGAVTGQLAEAGASIVDDEVDEIDEIDEIDEVSAVEDPSDEDRLADEGPVGDEDATDPDEEEVADAATELDVEPEPAARGNVVPLFRGRVVHSTEEPDVDESDEAQPDEHTYDDEDATVEDVDPLSGLFARLRSELPLAEPAADVAESDLAESDVGDSDAVDPVQDAAVDSPFERRDEVLASLVVGATRKMKRVLADEQNHVLETLRQRNPLTSIDQLLPGPDDHVASYSSAIDEELAGAMVAGAAELGLDDGRVLRARLAGAGAAEAAVAALRSGVIAPLRERILRAVSEAGGDNEAITQRVRPIYREWKTQHIDTGLDDVLRAAFSGGLVASIDAGAPAVWRPDPSVVACPECEDNSLSEPVRCGTAFPTGHTAPPAHPGCRCLVLPAD